MIQCEFMDYWIPAARNVVGGDSQRYHINSEILERLLKCDEYYNYNKRGYSEDVPMAPDLLRVVKLLAGPHHRTILKLLELQDRLDVSVLRSLRAQ